MLLEHMFYCKMQNRQILKETPHWEQLTLTKLEAQMGQKSLSWFRLIMICCIVPSWPSGLPDQIVFSNPESDVV